MKIRTFKYYIKEAIQSMRRNGLMSLASISTVTLSLFILGVFACGVVNLNNLASHLESQVQISIYLKDNLTTPQVMELGKKLKALPELKDIEFVTKDEAMKRFKERLGEQQQLVESLDGHNPLPTSYVLTFNTPEQVKSTAELVSKYPEVESAHYGQDVIEQIFEVTKIIRIGGIVLIALLAGATLFIISNTIRLTVFARRKEIGIMKYVGATNWFIPLAFRIGRYVPRRYWWCYCRCCDMAILSLYYDGSDFQLCFYAISANDAIHLSIVSWLSRCRYYRRCYW